MVLMIHCLNKLVQVYFSKSFPVFPSCILTPLLNTPSHHTFSPHLLHPPSQTPPVDSDGNSAHDLRKRFKIIASLADPDEAGLSSFERSLYNRFDAKPLLSRPQVRVIINPYIL
jgi:hypothetical protein